MYEKGARSIAELEVTLLSWLDWNMELEGRNREEKKIVFCKLLELCIAPKNTQNIRTRLIQPFTLSLYICL